MKIKIWKDIPGYEGFYQISNDGFVKSLERIIFSNRYKSNYKLKEKIIKSSLTSSGYLHINLSRNNIKTNYTIHRLVAENFIQNPLNLPQVNHKDRDKLNNNISNLEWCTSKENVLHLYKSGYIKSNLLLKIR